MVVQLRITRQTIDVRLLTEGLMTCIHSSPRSIQDDVHSVASRIHIVNDRYEAIFLLLPRIKYMIAPNTGRNITTRTHIILSFP